MNKNIIWSFLFVLTVVIAYSASSQEKSAFTQTDSLRKELNTKKGSDKIATQLELALRIMETEKPESQELANSALSAAKTAKNKNLEMRAYFVLGRVYDVMNNKDFAEAYYDTALTIVAVSGDNWYKGEILLRKGVITYNRRDEIHALEYFNASLQACRLSNNFKIMGSSYSMMGTIFRVNGLYDRAIEYIVNSKLNYEKAGFSEGNAWSAYILGRIYSDLKLPQKALEYFQEALEIYTKMASVDGNQNGVAICYEQIGLLKLESGNFKEAHKYIDNTLKIYTANKSEYGLSNSQKNLGMIEYSMGNYELAENYLNESLRIKNKVGDVLSLPTIYEYLGLCLIGKGQIDEGFKSLNRGLDLAIANNQTKIQLNIYLKLTEVYLSINDLENAIGSQKKQIEIQDLILSGAANIKIEQLQAIYELDRQNGQIIELEKQNEINSLIIKQQRISQLIMIFGIVVAFLVSISIYWFAHQIRNKNLQLKETNAAKDKFFAIIAHDLRGPTGNLAVFLEYLNETFNDHSPAELKKILLTLYKSAESVSVLLENLLIWAQSQLNKIEFNPTELKLTDVIQNSIKGLKQSADNKQIDIRFELNDEIFVLADPNMAQTIVRNLLSNAIKFTPRGGSVIIKTDVNNMNNANISITDNGVGIAKSSLSKIFDLSNTHHTTGTEDEQSTGLGLILVKDFIEKNKGTITIDSEKDKGTVVSFTLPATTT
ncbi:MAG: tetratricopeptide repeat-containing sensor histidine kinase [Bacteroidota bacterium]|nr:tetratricopeptide repeat-containing sensor histidine kinase [Bacteroidota bacterium]